MTKKSRHFLEEK